MALALRSGPKRRTDRRLASSNASLRNVPPVRDSSLIGRAVGERPLEGASGCRVKKRGKARAAQATLHTIRFVSVHPWDRCRYGKSGVNRMPISRGRLVPA